MIPPSQARFVSAESRNPEGGSRDAYAAEKAVGASPSPERRDRTCPRERLLPPAVPPNGGLLDNVVPNHIRDVEGIVFNDPAFGPVRERDSRGGGKLKPADGRS